MIAAFAAADQLRRRPAPVNTSMRRTGSGIGLCSEIDMCRSPRVGFEHHPSDGTPKGVAQTPLTSNPSGAKVKNSHSRRTDCAARIEMVASQIQAKRAIHRPTIACRRIFLEPDTDNVAKDCFQGTSTVLIGK
jgi:hypothetical protein